MGPTYKIKLECGATINKKVRNTDLALPSPCPTSTGYAVFIIVLFSALSLHVIYMTLSVVDDFKSSYGSKNGEM